MFAYRETVNKTTIILQSPFFQELDTTLPTRDNGELSFRSNTL